MEDILTKDVCARLPYKPIVDYEGEQYEILGYVVGKIAIAKPLSSIIKYIDVKDCRLYLRPMSSMTEEEIIEFNNIPSTKNYTIIENDLPWDVAHYKQIDWLNKKMFDYRELIPKGCAIAVTEENNPYKD